MAITLNSDGTITGVSTGGLPDGSIATADIANNAVTMDKLATSGTLPALDGSNLTGVGGGITEVDHWRITANHSTPRQSDSVLSSNWERIDTGNFEKIGTGLSQSSGIFTFPSTGKWFIQATFVFNKTSENNQYDVGQIDVTTNNSTYSTIAKSIGSVATNGIPFYATVTTTHLFDVTSTSTHKFRLSANTEDIAQLIGDTSETTTSVFVMRLGDT